MSSVLTHSTSQKNLSETADAIAEITGLLASVDNDKLNTIPYEGSWTAPQLLRHVSKSINGMTKALQMEAKPATRNPGEKIEWLKSIFLDFSKKLTQPRNLSSQKKKYTKNYLPLKS